MLLGLASLKYFPLVLSLILIIPFTPLEIPTIYGGDYINRISIPYRKGGVKTLSFLTGFTLLPIISSSHFPIISEAWSATYYVDATNGNDGNTGLSESSAWKTIVKVNASRFNPGIRRQKNRAVAFSFTSPNSKLWTIHPETTHVLHERPLF